MATKTDRPRPSGRKTAAGSRPPRPAQPGKAPGKSTLKSTVQPSANPVGNPGEKSGGSFLRHTLLPSAACGLLLAVVAVQEGASLAIAALVAVVMTGVVAGMVKLKRALYGG
jgi:hypothetical protein